MEECRAEVAGPRELDLAGHGGRREDEEGGEAAQRRGSGGLYKLESTWASGVASGEGGFGPEWLDGKRAERAGGGRNRGTGRREMEVRAYLRFLKIQGPLGKLKISPTYRAQMKKC